MVSRITGGGLLFFDILWLTLAFVASYIWYDAHSGASFYYIACFAMGIAFLTTGESLSNGHEQRIAFSLAKKSSDISYAIYLNHNVVYQIIKRFLFPEYRYYVILVYVIILVVYSVFTSWLLSRIKGLCLKII